MNDPLKNVQGVANLAISGKLPLVAVPRLILLAFWELLAILAILVILIVFPVIARISHAGGVFLCAVLFFVLWLVRSGFSS